MLAAPAEVRAHIAEHMRLVKKYGAAQLAKWESAMKSDAAGGSDKLQALLDLNGRRAPRRPS